MRLAHSLAQSRHGDAAGERLSGQCRPKRAIVTKSYEQRLQAAMERYEHQLQWYEVHASRDQLQFKAFQILTLVFTALTPVLIAFGGVAPGIEAASSAVAAVCAGTAAVFNWKGNWVRFARTSELLKSERAYFETRTGTYSLSLADDQALDAFMARIESAAQGETGEWVAEVTRIAQPHGAPQPAPSTHQGA
jgi:hypothetical protein